MASRDPLGRLAIGCAQLSNYDYGYVDPIGWRRAVQAGLDRGLTAFDVADIYGFGNAETLLAQALGDRSSVAIIHSKFGLRKAGNAVVRDSSVAWLDDALHSSLRRMRRDHIDYYYLHWYDGITPLATIFERLKHHQRSGKIGRIGASNLKMSELEEARALGLNAYQFPYSLLCRQPELDVLPYCSHNGIEGIAHSVLARGSLSDSKRRMEDFGADDTRRASLYFAPAASGATEAIIGEVRRVAGKMGRTPAQIALTWVLSKKRVSTAVVGVRNEQQLLQILEAAASDISRGLLEGLDALGGHFPAIMNGEFSKNYVEQPDTRGGGGRNAGDR